MLARLPLLPVVLLTSVLSVVIAVLFVGHGEAGH